MKARESVWRRVVGAVLLGVVAAVGGGFWWVQAPLSLATPTVELSIEPGMSPREVALAWVAAGVRTEPWLLYEWFRLSGQARRIRAGSYEIERGISPRGLLAKMVQGDEAFERIRLIEGWTFRQFRAELDRAPRLRHLTAGMSDTGVMDALGMPGVAPEGRFFPDTYLYSRDVSDLTVLRRAAAQMRRRLAAAWTGRRDGLPLRSPGDALTLASIVEKETGLAEDRARVAAVLLNRLKAGMPLQTDPSVIYGLGAAFDGNLRKRDLVADTPYNTYTRTGLPPTPISMPGQASLQAAVQPDATRALYFVARGDGSSAFSDDLAAHNRAVNEFQRRHK